MKYTCVKCGKVFEEDTAEIQALFDVYGWVRCVQCDIDMFVEMYGKMEVKE